MPEFEVIKNTYGMMFTNSLHSSNAIYHRLSALKKELNMLKKKKNKQSY